MDRCSAENQLYEKHTPLSARVGIRGIRLKSGLLVKTHREPGQQALVGSRQLRPCSHPSLSCGSLLSHYTLAEPKGDSLLHSFAQCLQTHVPCDPYHILCEGKSKKIILRLSNRWRLGILSYESFLEHKAYSLPVASLLI